eukprot:1432215-Heterocapsa_arctica.AAC.1
MIAMCPPKNMIRANRLTLKVWPPTGKPYLRLTVGKPLEIVRAATRLSRNIVTRRSNRVNKKSLKGMERMSGNRKRKVA